MRVALRVALHPWRPALVASVYLWDLVAASAVVAWEIVTPTHSIRPGIVRVPLEARTDFEIALLSNMVSFTPGTLTLGVERGRSAIYVHALHMQTPDDVREQVGRLEARILWMVR
ncbi:MAG: Na+/H+ antiporter subunit E [Thermoleophilia bacterium]|nr:Na+/H+ antiporter subunit E [Thermoleophilia bacterium]